MALARLVTTLAYLNPTSGEFKRYETRKERTAQSDRRQVGAGVVRGNQNARIGVRSMRRAARARFIRCMMVRRRSAHAGVRTRRVTSVHANAESSGPHFDEERKGAPGEGSDRQCSHLWNRGRSAGPGRGSWEFGSNKLATIDGYASVKEYPSRMRIPRTPARG